jgi:hypothetical protein
VGLGPLRPSAPYPHPSSTTPPLTPQLPIIFAGVWGLYFAHRYGYRARFVVPSLLMVFVGTGSVLFHGTLQYAGQALDELSMVYCVTAFLYLALENVPSPPKRRRRWLVPALVLYDACFTLAYVLLPAYFTFFVLTFIGLCAATVFLSGAMYRRTKDLRLRRLFWVGVSLYLGSFLFLWIPDSVFCAETGFLNLHSWFHVGSTVGPWWYISWTTFSFYTADMAYKTRTIPDPKGGLVPVAAPEDLMDYLRDIEGGGGGTGQGTLTTTAAAAAAAAAAAGTNAAFPVDSDPERAVVIVPELRWLGPRSLVLWPYIHLERERLRVA